ncbi:hypothetical protein BOTBODRAFT_191690 [Botryobasidium botryosum FD-172 SS1]|uniref:Uncharacterized protein n=1 Tax=Botryobasidium botryosum (strain FD-172 SS1) TaxID=930990 RepID=A0A067M9L2_BOTB1|nr:hypothetical protein BOTBODRAFT_191690 [Botryobasidium botryosum FD-172 SS1]
MSLPAAATPAPTQAPTGKKLRGQQANFRPYRIPANPPQLETGGSQAHWRVSLNGSKNPLTLGTRQCDLECNGSCCAADSTCCLASASGSNPCCPAQEFCWASTCCITASEVGCGPACMNLGGECCNTQGYWCDPGYNCVPDAPIGSPNFCILAGAASSQSVQSLASASSSAALASLGSAYLSVLSSQSIVSVRSHSGILPHATATTGEPASIANSKDQDPSGPNIRAIVGGVIGGVFALAGLLIVLLLLVREIRKKNRRPDLYAYPNQNQMISGSKRTSASFALSPNNSKLNSPTGSGSGSMGVGMGMGMGVGGAASMYAPRGPRTLGSGPGSVPTSPGGTSSFTFPFSSGPPDPQIQSQNPWISVTPSQFQGARPALSTGVHSHGSGGGVGGGGGGTGRELPPGSNPNPTPLISTITYSNRNRDR